MAEETEAMVLDEGRLDESTVGPPMGEIVWPREPGPVRTIKKGAVIKAVLESVLAAGPTGVIVLNEHNIGAALERTVARFKKRDIRESDTARRSRQATARTMSLSGVLIVRRGFAGDEPFVSFALTNAGRALAEELSGQKPGQDLDELTSRPWVFTFDQCARATDDDRRMGSTATHAAGAEAFGQATWPNEQTMVVSTVGPDFNAQKISVRAGSKIVPGDFIHSYRLRSSGTDLENDNSAGPQAIPVDPVALADDMELTAAFLMENREHPQPTQPFHVEAALEFLTPRDLAAVLEWLEAEGGKEAADFARNFMMTSGKTGVELILGLLLWMADNTWSGNANGARRSWTYMQIRRFSAMTLQSLIDLDTLQVAAAMPRNKVPVNDGTPDGKAGGSEEN